ASIRLLEIFFHIGNGKVLAFLEQLSMGMVAEHGVTGLHVLSVEYITFHALSINPEKVVGSGIVARKTNIDVFDLEQRPKRVLKTLHKGFVLPLAPTYQGGFDLRDGVFGRYVKHVGDDEALGNKTIGRDFLFP